jgi:hypothetical protein
MIISVRYNTALFRIRGVVGVAMFRVFLALVACCVCRIGQAVDSDIKRTEAELGVSVVEEEPTGVRVVRVTRGSAASDSGIRVGDRILKINDTEIKTPDGLIRALESFEPGERVKVEILRDEEKRSIDVRLRSKGEYSYDASYRGNSTTSRPSTAGTASSGHAQYRPGSDRPSGTIVRGPSDNYYERDFQWRAQQLQWQLSRTTESLAEMQRELAHLRSTGAVSPAGYDTDTASPLPSPPPILTPAMIQVVPNPGGARPEGGGRQPGTRGAPNPDVGERRGEYAVEEGADRYKAVSGTARIDLSKYPVFELPAPEPHSHCEVPESNWRSVKPKTFADVENYLRTALTGADYYDVGTLLLPADYDGFALVTPPEQTTSDGTPEEDKLRWNPEVKPLSEEGFNFGKYIRSVFFTRPGYFRSFVFVFSARPIQKDEKTTTRDEVVRWKQRAMSRLPAEVAQRPISESHQLEVLVYEFLQEDKGRAVKLQEHPMPAKTHLQRAKVWDRLEKPRTDANAGSAKNN